MFNPESPRRIQRLDGCALVPTLLADVWLRVENGQAGTRDSYRLPLGNKGIDVFLNQRPLIGKHISYAKWNRHFSEIERSALMTGDTMDVNGTLLPILGLNALCQGNVKIEFSCTSTNIGVRIFIPPFD